ncbi:MAG: hypothetical protein KF683_15305 [Rubrivivax sp.]|nr:hypothetical protein [Rubrivivax sp.]
MRKLPRPALPLVLLLTLAAPVAFAGPSSASSAASDSLTTSSGSVSTSSEASSDSSKTEKRTAAGDYRVAEVSETAARPGLLRLRLQAVETQRAGYEFFLYVPQQTAQDHGVASGQVLTARERPYGLEFAMARTRTPFFLLLDDDWQGELSTRPLTL